MYEGIYEMGDISCNAFIDLLLSLNEYELTLLGFAIGFLLSPTITVNQQNSLGNFFELIGQTLLTINAQSVNLQPNAPSRQQLNDKIKRLEEEIKYLRAQINFWFSKFIICVIIYENRRLYLYELCYV